MTSIPAEIGQLSSLPYLELEDNNLTSLPVEIGQLTSLIHLHLYNNQLTSLPAEIGQLSLLNDLYLHDNQLTSLPASLTNLIKLTYLSCPQYLHNQRDVILDEIKLKRSKQSIYELPQKLKFWLTYCNSNCEPSDDMFNLKEFIQSLTEKKTIYLYEYLTRLQQVKDFSHNPTQLANHLFNFLKLAQTNNEFSDMFYTELKENNTRCQDRTAMSTNVIYTYYMLFSLQENNRFSFKENSNRIIKDNDEENKDSIIQSISLNSATIQTFVSLAKTFTLRSIIQNYLIKNSSTESVEIYLYYESNLKEKLKLTTIMESMHYPGIGNKQTNLTFEYLINEVNDTYTIYLLNLEIFMKLVKTNEEYKSKFDNILDEAYSQIELNPDNSLQIMEDKKNKELNLIKTIIEHYT